MSDVDLVRKAEVILGLIRLKEDIYRNGTQWNEAKRRAYCEAIRGALDLVGALDAEFNPSHVQFHPSEPSVSTIITFPNGTAKNNT